MNSVLQRGSCCSCVSSSAYDDDDIDSIMHALTLLDMMTHTLWWIELFSFISAGVGLGLLTAVWFNEPEERLSPGSEKRYYSFNLH